MASLVETIDLVVKASKRPNGEVTTNGGLPRAQISQIGAEDNGEEYLVGARGMVTVVVAMGTLEDVVDLGESLVGEVPLVGVNNLSILLHPYLRAWPLHT